MFKYIATVNWSCFLTELSSYSFRYIKIKINHLKIYKIDKFDIRSTFAITHYLFK